MTNQSNIEYYLLSYAWYEDYSPTILKGPKVDNWEQYCNSKLNEAVSRLLEKYKGDWEETLKYQHKIGEAMLNETLYWSPEQHEEFNAKYLNLRDIGTNDIVYSLLGVLVDEGYEIVKPQETTYFGSTMISVKTDMDEKMQENIRGDLIDKILHIHKVYMGIHEIDWETNSDVQEYF